MMRMAMSPAAAGVLRGLILRSGVDRNRILLTHGRSADWHSLTFTGERHSFALRITGAGSGGIAERICADLEDAEFDVPGAIVADIALVGQVAASGEDSELTIEALTVADD